MINKFICSKCFRVGTLHTPLLRCKCGEVIKKAQEKKYVIDFTLHKHGEFIIKAKTEEEAEIKFKKWIQNSRKATEKFLEFTIYDTEIDTNYVVRNVN